jgi:energy-coupling factor transporter ATP-binding protein EcfA2
MSKPLLIERETTLVRDLFRLVADRTAAESTIESDFQSSIKAASGEFRDSQRRILERFESQKAAAEAEFQELRERITARFESEHGAAQREFQQVRERIADHTESELGAAKQDYDEARWMAGTVYEATKNEANELLNQAKRRVSDGEQKLQAIRLQATALLKEWRQKTDETESGAAEHGGSALSGDPFARFADCVSDAHVRFNVLQALRLPRLFIGSRILWLNCALGLLAAGLAWLISGSYLLATATSAAAAVMLTGAISYWLYLVARSQVGRTLRPLHESLRDGERLAQLCRDQAAAEHERCLSEAKRRRAEESRQAEDRYHARRVEIEQYRNAELRAAARKYPDLLTEIKTRRDRDWQQAHEKYPRLLVDLAEQCERDLRQTQECYYQAFIDSKVEQEERWSRSLANWRDGLEHARTVAAEVIAEGNRLFPPWADPAWREWSPPRAFPRAIRFGGYSVSLDEIPDGVPQDDRFRPETPLELRLPAFIPFPAGSSLLIKASGTGKALAVQALQALMVRLLSSIPPGKLRFTIIDPVGLGENFAGFMHLADHDESLISSRIWTEAQHIDQRLCDLTAHMENVIQKYLRNEFETIEEYNAHAGEVAEPFRILVVANFPVNFSSEAARRLISIASSGARCGVYTLITADTKQPLPHGCNLKDLEQYSVNLAWRDGRFLWDDEDFGRFPLEVDAPPDAEFTTRVLQVVGREAKEASRVEVPFEFVAPPADQWWKGDSRPGIRVPLGRAGATKLQYLRLGEGTAQHVLIAGKTGSGKSTLLHALITNLSLVYSPEEVELYLVDFKKGVEFKAYAVHELPHARVVAIESEREFGLSVLQRLDAELKSRGDRFRAAGVQDLNAYRELNGSTPLPRVLLIVDEFQEFFVEDDKIAQEASLLLDRLVRQGRAFGIHVHLGSQTLGGAYALARSTMSQMAVRIALQCSESDAHLILSEDNTAARLLSRPGEAIYNDANGRVEGNSLFQVVWLPDDRREEYLRRIQDLTRQRGLYATGPQIVFEGNTFSDLSKNHLLNHLLAEPNWPGAPRTGRTWLGEAVAIKDPTSAAFHAQSGSNLLLIGQHEEAALAALVSALVSLAAEHTPVAMEDPEGAGAQFYVLDGSRADGPGSGLLARVVGALPHEARIVRTVGLQAILAELAAEVSLRQQATGVRPPIYLLVHDLGRFRDLRRQEDDFSFARRSEDQAAGAAELFGNVLRDGSHVGVHTIVWCDTLNNLNRTVERQMLHEFEMRVLFQMGASDSSNLIDSPLASKLGRHRALFYSEEQGRLERFRPYGLPPHAWLDWVEKQLRGRAKSQAALSEHAAAR